MKNPEMTWDSVKRHLTIGRRMKGIVTYQAPFGIFVAFDDMPFEGLVLISNFKDEGKITPQEYPTLGATIEAVVLGFKDKGNQILLSMKPSHLSQASIGGAD